MPWTGPPPPPDWAPFLAVAPGLSCPGPRKLGGPHGLGDRMRIAAFAELQARQAFLWGAATFDEAPDALRQAWRDLAAAEDKHLRWLLERMAALGIPVQDRPVSPHLFAGLTDCRTAHEFAWYMAKAEDRGRIAGEQFARKLATSDPESARIFGQIAAEEQEHIDLALRFFPESDRTRTVAP